VKQEDRERIGRALLRGVPKSDDSLYRLLEGLIVADVDAIEPVVDKIIAREAARAAELALEMSSLLEDD